MCWWLPCRRFSAGINVSVPAQQLVHKNLRTTFKNITLGNGLMERRRFCSCNCALFACTLLMEGPDNSTWCQQSEECFVPTTTDVFASHQAGWQRFWPRKQMLCVRNRHLFRWEGYCPAFEIWPYLLTAVEPSRCGSVLRGI